MGLSGSKQQAEKLSRSLHELDFSTIHQLILDCDVSILDDGTPGKKAHIDNLLNGSVEDRRKQIARYIFHHLLSKDEFSCEKVVSITKQCIFQIFNDLSVFYSFRSVRSYVFITLAEKDTPKARTVFEKLTLEFSMKDRVKILHCVINNAKRVDCAKTLAFSIPSVIRCAKEFNNCDFCDMIYEGRFEMFQFILDDLKVERYISERCWYQLSDEMESVAKKYPMRVLKLFENSFYRRVLSKFIDILHESPVQSRLNAIKVTFEEHIQKQVQTIKDTQLIHDDIASYLVLRYI